MGRLTLGKELLDRPRKSVVDLGIVGGIPPAGELVASVPEAVDDA